MKSSLERMRAVVVDRASPGGLAMRMIDKPLPRMCKALVRVAATSLNRGEVEQALTGSKTGTRLGWDLAGVIEVAAVDGSGPPAGTRVVGVVRAGAWAELVAVPVRALTSLPRAVSFTQAAALPVAGLTALHVLDRGGSLLGRRVLVNGATGGVGLFAVQLAYAAGALVTAVTRNPEHKALLEDYGADHVVVGDIVAAAGFGPYHLILDAVGGPGAAALKLLRPGGTCVQYGTAGTPGTPGSDVHGSTTGDAALHGFSLRKALRLEPASEGLKRLLILVETNKIEAHVEVEDTWTSAAVLAQALLDRLFVGKAILHL